MPLTLHHEHTWNPAPHEAIGLQNQLKNEILTQPLPEKVELVGGLDVGYKNGRARAAAVVFDFPTMKVAEQSVVEMEVAYPYIPGLFSFREVPPLLAAIELLGVMPEVWLCDGQGIAHPRRFGLACHLGVLLDLPTVGCAKSVLVGKFSPMEPERGSVSPLLDKEEVIGMALRTRDKVSPVFVSVGHRADLDSSVKLVLACGRGLRHPEPLRLAHKLTIQNGASSNGSKLSSL